MYYPCSENNCADQLRSFPCGGSYSPFLLIYFKLCHRAYELAQANHRGAHVFRSIDDIYIGPWRGSATGRVTLEHVPGRPTEMRAGQGDVVRFLNNWDGYAGIGTKQNHT